MKRDKNESYEEYKAKVARRLAEDKEFYSDVAEILGTVHDYNVPYGYRTRWNARTLGNGRYPGFGVIQCFGPTVRVILKYPVKLTKLFDSKLECIDYLKRLGDEPKI